MKLVRYGPPGTERPGVVDASGTLRDLSAHVNDITGDTLGAAGLSRLATLDPSKLPRVDGTPRLGPCVAGTGKFICIGLNYSDHAAEAGMTVPAEPVVFMKATSAIVGPDDDIEIPRQAHKTDWEVELAVVIGRSAKYVDPEQALDYVALPGLVPVPVHDPTAGRPDRNRHSRGRGTRVETTCLPEGRRPSVAGNRRSGRADAPRRRGEVTPTRS